MSIENLLKKINEKDAFLQEKIKKEIEEEKNNINVLLDNDLENFKTNSNINFQKKLQNLKNSKETELETFRQKNILKIKREILESVLDEFFKQFKNFDKEKYFTYIKNSIEKLTKNIVFSSKSKVFIGNDLECFDNNQNFENEIKIFIKKTYNFDEKNIFFDKNIIFGVFYSDDRINIDLSYKAIFDEISSKYEIKISKILFGNNDEKF